MSDTRKPRERLDALLTELEDDILRSKDAVTTDVEALRSRAESLIEAHAVPATGTGPEEVRLRGDERVPWVGEDPRQVKAWTSWWESLDESVWRKLPIREMRRRGWFDVPRDQDELVGFQEYFARAAGPEHVAAYHRKKSRGNRSSNEYALWAWQARILERAQERGASGGMPAFRKDHAWLPDLVGLTRESDGPSAATEFLAAKGVVLVMERHLPGTYLDGAAMLGAGDRPIIGLTLRHDRLDNFWFVLLHELGHVFLHLKGGEVYDFFDEDDAWSGDRIEQEADRFALDTLISVEEWKRCLSRFTLTEKAVRADADRIGVHPSILAGRIRRERNNYTVLTELVGQWHVRREFEEDADDPP